MLDFSSDALAETTNADSTIIIVNVRDIFIPIPPFRCLKQKRNKKLSYLQVTNI
jgi:hypothetical protein